MAVSNSSQSQHRAVTIRCKDHGRYEAELRAQWKYEQPYARDHLETVTVDGNELTLSPGDSRHFSDVTVTLSVTEIELTT